MAAARCQRAEKEPPLPALLQAAAAHVTARATHPNPPRALNTVQATPRVACLGPTPRVAREQTPPHAAGLAQAAGRFVGPAAAAPAAQSAD